MAMPDSQVRNDFEHMHPAIMDDSFEQPSLIAPKADDVPLEDDDQSSGDEDGALDWTKIIPTVARPVVPKRGEKEFEPRANGGTNLQLHILDRARSAMFEALRSVRTISSKGISYGVWYPGLGRTHVTVSRGIHFSTMGHSAPRPFVDENGATKIHKRLELLPEEAIYLIERGALFCWKECDMDLSSLQGFEGFAGVPMSVQQAYAEMIGRENLTLDKFQVYAYLRRLGYVVTRTNAPNDSYPLPPPFDLSQPKKKAPLLCRIFSPIYYILSRARRIFTRGFNWWKPLSLSRWLHHDYASIYRSLRFMPSGHDIILNRPALTSSVTPSPFRIFFNVYKPSTPFKKTAPPLPDFQVVVVNARTTPMPTLHDLSALFDLLPDLPPPVPRPRRQAYGIKPAVPTPVIATPSPHSPSTFLQRLFPFLFSPPKQSQEPRRRPNPFAALKQGKKIIVIAAVDNGNISFFRFSQGAFEEWPMA